MRSQKQRPYQRKTSNINVQIGWCKATEVGIFVANLKNSHPIHQWNANAENISTASIQPREAAKLDLCCENTLGFPLHRFPSQQSCKLEHQVDCEATSNLDLAGWPEFVPNSLLLLHHWACIMPHPLPDSSWGIEYHFWW